MTAAEATGQPETTPTNGARPARAPRAAKAVPAATPASAPAVATVVDPNAPAPDLRNLQDKFNALLEQRNTMNDLARKAADERNQLNEQRRGKAAGIEASKVARDAANEEMRKHKELRNAYQDQAKALIAEKKG